MALTDDQWEALLEQRATEPQAAVAALRDRARRPLLTDGRLFVVAADHTARGMLGVGADPLAMADRRRLLDGLVAALAHPGVDGVLGSADVLEELALLGALGGKLAFGTMNRGGLAGARWELDDRMTAYDAESIADGGLDGGKVLLRIADDDAGTASTLQACAAAVSALGRRGLPIMVEPLPYRISDDGRGRAGRRRRPAAARRGRCRRARHDVDVHVAEGAGRPRRGQDAGRDDAAGTDPRRLAGRRPGGGVRGVGAGDGRPQRARPRRRDGPCCTRRTGTWARRSTAPRGSSGRRSAVADLHRRAGTLADGADPVRLSPADAGWARCGLRVLRLAGGEWRSIDTGEDEVVVLPLSITGLTVDVDGRAVRARRAHERLRPGVRLRLRRTGQRRAHGLGRRR